MIHTRRYPQVIIDKVADAINKVDKRKHHESSTSYRKRRAQAVLDSLGLGSHPELVSAIEDVILEAQVEKELFG